MRKYTGDVEHFSAEELREIGTGLTQSLLREQGSFVVTGESDGPITDADNEEYRRNLDRLIAEFRGELDCAVVITGNMSAAERDKALDRLRAMFGPDDVNAP